MLSEILQSKRAQIKKLAKISSVTSFEVEAEGFKHRNFSEKLARNEESNQIGVIAEVKKASPSKGILRENFQVKNIARLYENNSAACISVLTDQKFFKGSIENLIQARREISIPVLRKDFIIDPLQVAESYAMHADCILLIAAALPVSLLLELESQALSYGIDCLLEVHNEGDLEKAMSCKSKLIGINNRNLEDFSVNLETSLRLNKTIPPTKLVISESGIKNSGDIKLLTDNGIRTFLIGETFMRQECPGQALKKLLSSYAESD
ncbi:indole-3-glycerol phosphate synthase TrpC [Betaproteobacteria bacterium]|nr:indole-3-glycerol phosphate synthase TrpC [Betaproteobacteria bacterium]